LPDTSAKAGDKPAAPNAGGAGHPDLHVVFKELARFDDDRTIRERKLSSIPVEVLRSAMLDPVSRASHLRHNKVFIVDEAELLASVAQNLLLKTLEEPPAGTHVILVTSKEHRLLPTIRSRCQRVGFAPVSEATVRGWLGEHYSNVPARQHDWLVVFAEGSLGQAQLAVRYDLHAWAQQIEPALDELHRGRFPTQLGKLIADAANDFAERWVKAHTNASKDAANRQGAALMWSLIAQHARRGLASAAATCRSDDPAAGEATVAPWLRAIDALDEAERHLASNVNMGLVMDHVAVRMSGD
jgi:DNA polymerase-3 subunit delta'